MEKKIEIGVIVARFQVPSLSPGHIYLINEVIRRSDKIIIFLGDCPKCDSRNPLPYDIRMQMVYEHYKEFFHFKKDEKKMEIYRLPDHSSDEVWNNSLDLKINVISKINSNVTLYGSRDSFSKAYTGKFPYVHITGVSSKSGTEIRQEVLLHEKNESFRAGIIYAHIKKRPY